MNAQQINQEFAQHYMTLLITEGLTEDNRIYSNYVQKHGINKLIANGLIEQHESYQVSLTDKGLRYIIRHDLVNRAETNPIYTGEL